MWLLHTSTLKLHYFSPTEVDQIPYAILSHTWDKDEVSFQDVMNGGATQRHCYHKLENFCRLARDKYRLEYCWMDTCCVDKGASAELDECLNSMFQWYCQAKVCFVYLSDYDGHEFPPSETRWFTRGWTLQELLGPSTLLFYNKTWDFVGRKSDLVREIAAITGIDHRALEDRSTIPAFSVATRMSWAAQRRTLLVEDRAYSLLGLFGVSLPMLYGERMQAFIRLQRAIIESTNDQSILAWTLPHGSAYRSLLAPSPAWFAGAHNIIDLSSPDGFAAFLQVESHGIEVKLPIYRHKEFGPIAILNCRRRHDRFRQICLPITAIAPSSSHYVVQRKVSQKLIEEGWTRHNDYLEQAETQTILLLKEPPRLRSPFELVYWQRKIVLIQETAFATQFRLVTHPRRLLNIDCSMITIPIDESLEPALTMLYIQHRATDWSAKLHIYFQHPDIVVEPFISFQPARSDIIIQYNDLLPSRYNRSSKLRLRAFECSTAIDDNLAIRAELQIPKNHLRSHPRLLLSSYAGENLTHLMERENGSMTRPIYRSQL